MTARRTSICCSTDVARQQTDFFFRNEIEERKLHLATGNWEMTAGTWEGLESFEIRERQIAAKGQSGGMSSGTAACCRQGREMETKARAETSAAPTRHLPRPRMSHFIAATSIYLSRYKKKDSLPCRSPGFAAKRAGLGPAAALTHLSCIWPGPKLLHPTCVLSSLEDKFNPWCFPVIQWLGIIKAMVLFTEVVFFPKSMLMNMMRIAVT